MRFIEFLTEMSDEIGAVVSSSNGKFYDIDFVNYNTLEPLDSYLQGIGNHFIRQFQEGEGEFNDLLRFFPTRFRGKPLGEEYSDEDAKFTLYGPMSERQLGSLWDEYADEKDADQYSARYK